MDSPLRFRTKDPFGNRFQKYCTTVSIRPDKDEVCNYEGVGIHCPVTCGLCTARTTCSDSTLSFKSEKFKAMITCENIKTDIKDGCMITGIYETCRGTCQSSCQCQDSPHRFITEDQQGTKFSRKCINVSKRDDKDEVCKFEGVSMHCPVTCGSCPTLRCSDSTLIFDTGSVRSKCGLIASNVESGCEISGMLHTCRGLCNPSCISFEAHSSEPSTAPSTSSGSASSLAIDV